MLEVEIGAIKASSRFFRAAAKSSYLSSITQPQQVEALQLLTDDGTCVPLRASLGLELNNAGDVLEALLVWADQTLYPVKAMG